MTFINDLIKINVTYPDTSVVNVAGKANRLLLERGNRADLTDDLDPGTMTLDLIGTTYSPATNSNIRPRRKVAIQAKDDTDTYRTIWAGRLDVPTITYRKKGPPITRFPALDAMGYAGIFPQAEAINQAGTDLTMLEMCQVVGGEDTATPDYLLISESPSASTYDEAWLDEATPEGGSKLDYFTKIRNQVGGYIWADPTLHNGIKIRGYDITAPTLPMASDSATDTTAIKYTNIDLSHSAGIFKNAINFETPDGYQSDTYVDSDTLGEWSYSEDTLPILSGEMYGYDFTAFAEYWLGQEPLPGLAVRSITFDATKRRDLFALDPLYRTIQVKHHASGHDATYLVTKESHDITSTTWLTTYYLKPAGTRTVEIGD